MCLAASNNIRGYGDQEGGNTFGIKEDGHCEFREIIFNKMVDTYNRLERPKDKIQFILL